MGFPNIRDHIVYPTIIHYPLFLYPLFVTRHKLVPSLCIPARAARTWEEKGFVGTWSDGGKGGEKLSVLQHTYNSICETHCIVSNHKRRLVCIVYKSHLLIAGGEETERKTMINGRNFLHKDIKQ